MLDHLIGRAPAHLHTILATRTPLKLPTLVRWRVTANCWKSARRNWPSPPPKLTLSFATNTITP
jgi:hypothetical protein